MIKIFIISLTILVFSSSCRKRDLNSEKNSTINAILPHKIPTLDPAKSYDTISGTVLYQTYETLYQYHYLKRPYTIIPLLAESMPKIENRNTKYTIKIKKNILYHPNVAFKGKPRYVVAQDFINQIKRLAYIPTKSSGWWLVDKKIKGLNLFRKKAGSSFKKFKALSVKGLYTTDKHTLVIELLEPMPQLIFSLAMTFTSPLPIEAIEYYKNNLSNTIIGTGPYRFNKWTNPKELLLKKFKNYRDSFYPTTGDRKSITLGLLKDAGKKIPFIDNIRFQIVQKTQERWKKFINKEADFLVLPRDYYRKVITLSGDLDKSVKSQNIKLSISPTLTYWWLSFNMKDKLVGKNKYLRYAIAHAIDVDKFIRMSNNIDLKANSIFPPGIPGYNPANQLPYEYNPKKVSKYLKLAGYPNAKGLPTLRFEVRGTSEAAKIQADFFKDQLSQFNIKLDLVLNSFQTFLQKARNGKFQFWQDGWNLDYPDADNVLQLLASSNHAPGPNSTFYTNKFFDELFSKLKTLPDGIERRKIMYEMEQTVHEDLPWIMLNYQRQYLLYHDYLYNNRPSDLIANRFKYLKIDRN